MKKLSLLIALGLIAFYSQGQTKLPSMPSEVAAPAKTSVPQASKMPPLDASPMDMAYYPTDYPTLKAQNKIVESPLIRVIYSRPQRNNRKIFGELIEYGKVWRLGANEATEVEFFKDATIEGKKLPKGRYTMYAVPTATKWTIIFNKDTDTWGAFVYDEKKDALRVDVPVQAVDTVVENFSMSLTKSDKGANLMIAWENTSVILGIGIK